VRASDSFLIVPSAFFISYCIYRYYFRPGIIFCVGEMGRLYDSSFSSAILFWLAKVALSFFTFSSLVYSMAREKCA